MRRNGADGARGWGVYRHGAPRPTVSGWPFNTRSPALTHSSPSGPRCCCSGMIKVLGRERHAAAHRWTAFSFPVDGSRRRNPRSGLFKGGEQIKHVAPRGSLAPDRLHVPLPVGSGGGDRSHFNTVGRARGDAQIAAGAEVGDDGVHGAGGADDGVHRAGLNARCSRCSWPRRYRPPYARLSGGFAAQRLRLDVEQLRQLQHHLFAARRAFVDHLAVGHRLGVGAATGVAALAALALRQDRVDLLGNRIPSTSKRRAA